jgi:hypothetical protein
LLVRAAVAALIDVVGQLIFERLGVEMHRQRLAGLPVGDRTKARTRDAVWIGLAGSGLVCHGVPLS